MQTIKLDLCQFYLLFNKIILVFWKRNFPSLQNATRMGSIGPSLERGYRRGIQGKIARKRICSRIFSEHFKSWFLTKLRILEFWPTRKMFITGSHGFATFLVSQHSCYRNIHVITTIIFHNIIFFAFATFVLLQPSMLSQPYSCFRNFFQFR